MTAQPLTLQDVDSIISNWQTQVQKSQRDFSACNMRLNYGTACHKTLWVLKVYMNSKKPKENPLRAIRYIASPLLVALSHTNLDADRMHGYFPYFLP